MWERGDDARSDVAEDEGIVEVEVEEVGDIPLRRFGGTVTPPCPRRYPETSFSVDDAEGDAEGDIAEVAVEHSAPPPEVAVFPIPAPAPAATPTPVPAPAKKAPRKQLRPPSDRTAALLRVLIALALAVLLGLGVYLFSLLYPESYARFRSYFPAGWYFPPRVSSSAALPLPGDF